MGDLAHLRIWDDPAIRDSLSWYLDVAENRRPAKFRIAATVATRIAPAASSEDALWAELDRLTPVFLARWQAIRAGASLPQPAEGPSLLELCRELAYRMLAHCNFCPWNCRVDRLAGTKFGACKLASVSRVSSHFHHTGEELFFRGTEGSGTIFFTSCNMRCAFCQNGDISTDKDNGEETDPRTLAAMAWTLRREGCHNVNWVGGEVVIHLHTIVDAIALLGRDFAPTQAELKRARRSRPDRFLSLDEAPEKATYGGRFNAPMLWNSNFFMTLESMKILRLLADVWLPDFKFGPGRCAMTLARTPWYWETVTRNISLIAEWGEDFSIRHLVMPNHVECCSYPVLEWIAQHVPAVPVNVMAQFHPDNFCDPTSGKYRDKYAAIARRPSRAELDGSWRRARELGLKFETTTFERRGVFGTPTRWIERNNSNPSKTRKTCTNHSSNCLVRRTPAGRTRSRAPPRNWHCRTEGPLPMKPACLLVATFLWVTGGVLAAEPFRIGLPVECAFGSICSVQNYVDLDPGPGRLDPGCGRLSYDGHDGTDIRVRDLVAMREGVKVVAAAEGVVKATRDGMADVSVRETGLEAVSGREAGNGVLIDHGEGWETQYSHMRSGSVSVEPGDRVNAGTPLGLIGLSGQTEFPHLHFTLRREGVAVDPYTGAAGAWTCGSPQTSIWTEDAAEILTYAPTGLLVAGFSSMPPEAEAIRRGDQRLGQNVRDPETLVLWADVFGAQAGDVQSFSIIGPDGSVILDEESVLDGSNVSWFAFGGRRRPSGGWAPGIHVGRFTLARNGETIISHRVEIAIER